MKPADEAPLQAQRRALQEQLLQGLASAAPLAQVQDMQNRLRLLDGVLAGAPGTRWRAWRRQAVALVAVGAVVSAVAWVPSPRTPFTLEVQASAAQLQMDAAGSLGGQALAGALRAEGYSRLETADPGLAQRAREAGDASQLALQAERLNLRRVSYASGALLDFSAGAPAARLAIEGAVHAAEFEFGGAVSSSLAGAPAVAARYEVAEWLKLSAGATATELWLAGRPDRPLVWQGLRPRSVRLMARQADADGQVRLGSALQKAVLRLPSIEKELTLAAGSQLELDGLQVEQAELSVGPVLNLRLSGTASRLQVQTAGYARSLVPSLLEVLAHNHSLGLLWGAAGLLWGISTWLRKQWGEGA